MKKKTMYYFTIVILIQIAIINAFIALLFIKGTGRTMVWEEYFSRKAKPVAVTEIIQNDPKSINRYVKIVENNSIINVFNKLYVEKLKSREVFKIKF